MRLRAALAVVVCLWPAGGRGPDRGRFAAEVDIPDLIRMVRKQPASTNQSPSEANVSFLPTISSNPAIGVGVGVVASLASRRTGPDGPMSSAQASLTLTTKKQVIAALRNNFYSRSEDWSLVGDVRLAKFYQRVLVSAATNRCGRGRFNVDYNWIRFYQTAYRRVGGAFHVGIGYHLDSFIDIEPADERNCDEVRRT